MALTGKQVRQLRALAHHLNPVVHIAEVVQVIGHRFSLYRASSRKDIEHIKLD